MFRSAFIFLAAAAAVAAPVPKAAKPPDYFPYQPGDTWVLEQAGTDSTITRTVTAADTKEGTTALTMSIHWGNDTKTTQTERYEVTAAGAWQVEEAGPDGRTKAEMTRPGMTAGDTWEVKYTRHGTDFHYRVAVGKPKAVAVPAGTYTAVPLTLTDPLGVQPPIVRWYADGVGLVKTECEIGGKPVQFELKSYTRGSGK